MTPQNFRTRAAEIIEKVITIGKKPVSIPSTVVSAKQLFASVTICAMLSPIFSLPVAASAAYTADPYAPSFEPVNEDLPFWKEIVRGADARFEELITPYRTGNASVKINDKTKANEKSSDLSRDDKEGEIRASGSDKREDTATFSNSNKGSQPANSETAPTVSGSMLMNQPADRPILPDSQVPTLLSPGNNLGSPFGQTEASATTSAVATRTRERAGIGNFGFSLPAAFLAGRNLDASVNINYNSQLWTESLGQFTYNVDGNWLAPGFQMGFGYLDAYRDGTQLPSTFVLTEADGTRRQFNYISGTSGSGSNFVFETSDGSFTRLEFSYCNSSPCSPQGQGPLFNLRVTYADGSKVFYPTANPQNRYFPKKFLDVQGNYLSIYYLANDEVGKISYITDTLGRSIHFHYDSSSEQKLIAITVPGYDGSATRRQTIRFYYETIALQWQNRFSGTTVAPSYITVLKYVYMPGTKTGYRYHYSPQYGMIYKISQLRGMQVSTDSLTQLGSVNETSHLEAAWTRYNYPGTDIEPPATTLSDVPKYNKRIDDWIGRTPVGSAAPEVIYNVTEDSTTRTTYTTTPDNTTSVSVSHKKPGLWDDGLLKETYVTSPARPEPWAKSIYTWQYGQTTLGRRNPRIEKIEATNDAGLAKATTYGYDVYNNQTLMKEHDYAATGQIGTELRRTETSYARGVNNMYPGSVKTIVNNVIVSRTDFEYDGFDLFGYGPNPVTQHDPAYNPDSIPGEYCYQVCPAQCEDPAFPQHVCHCDRVTVCDPIPVYDPATANRGNLTKITRFVDPYNNNDPNASVDTMKYDMTGNVVEASASCCDLKTWEYAATNHYAYATKETQGTGPQLVTRAVYDFNTGAATKTIDENNQETNYLYEADTLRLKKTTFANGGYTENFFSDKEIMSSADLVPGYVRAKTTLETNKFAESYSYSDGGGLGLRNATLTPDGWSVSAVEYDSLGRARKSYNPFYALTPTGAVPAGTKFTEVTGIDALGRTTGVKLQDDTNVSTAFSTLANTPTGFKKTFVTVTDQADKQRRQVSDALGRIVRVDEPASNGSLGAVDASLPNQQTIYEYDGNDNLSKVLQSEANQYGTVTQERRFKYDALSRLTHEKQVEATPTLNDEGVRIGAGGIWTKFLKYRLDGLLEYGRDARGVKTEFIEYDGLNRVKEIRYSDGTPTVKYHYDQARTGFFNSGAITKVETVPVTNSPPETLATATEFDYDLMGQVKKHRQWIAGQQYDLEYVYNLAGQLTSEKYPSGRVVSMGSDANGRPTTIADMNRTYITGMQFQGKGNSVSRIAFGNGTMQNFTLNDRLQMITQDLKRGSDLLQKYDYAYGELDSQSVLKNNGKLESVVSHIGTTKQWTQKFAYDHVGRLKQSEERRGDTNALTYKQTFDFDRFGNLYRKQANNSPAGQEHPLPYSQIEEATTTGTGDIEKSTNRFRTETVYDDAGNVTTDNKVREMGFSYDANGRMVKAIRASVSDASSVYDASGLRVAEKVNDVWRFLIYDIGGKLVVEYGGLQSTDEGGVKYTLRDWQGSTRAIVSNSGYIGSRRDYNAFGEGVGTGTGVRTAQQGYGVFDSLRQRYGLTERDDATGLDHTWFRKLENQAGRWTSPDPYDGSMEVSDPQTFNRYSYVENDPSNFIDPSGLNASSAGYTWSCYITWRSDWDGSNFRITSVSCQTWSNGGGGGVGDGSSGNQGGQGQTGIPKDCKNALSKAGLLKKVQNKLKSGPYYDVNKIQNESASKYFGKKGTKGLTVGDWFDNRPHGGAGATTVTGGSGVTGIYSRGGESSLSPSLKLHEATHLAQGGSGDLDVSLANRLKVDTTGQTASKALSNYFDKDCDPSLLKKGAKK